MSFDHGNLRLRRALGLVALSALLGLSAAGLTQCRLVDDTVTGTELNTASGTSSRSSCVRQCNEQRKACFRAEDARHKAAKRACGTDNSCKKAEERLHRDNHKECVRQSQLCKRGCYNEGAGSAGR